MPYLHTMSLLQTISQSRFVLQLHTVSRLDTMFQSLCLSSTPCLSYTVFQLHSLSHTVSQAYMCLQVAHRTAQLHTVYLSDTPCLSHTLCYNCTLCPIRTYYLSWTPYLNCTPLQTYASRLYTVHLSRARFFCCKICISVAHHDWVAHRHLICTLRLSHTLCISVKHQVSFKLLLIIHCPTQLVTVPFRWLSCQTVTVS